MADQTCLNKSRAEAAPTVCRPFSGALFCFLSDPCGIGVNACSPQEETMELHYCHTGRLQIHDEGGSCTLVSGDVWFVPKHLDAGHICSLSKYYAGLSLVLTPRLIRQEVGAFSADFLGVDMDTDRLASELRGAEGDVIHGASAVSQAFSQIFLEKRPYRQGFLRLKTMELLLYLNAGKPDGQQAGQLYLERSQVERVQEIRQYLTDHLNQRMTQTQVAKQFHLSLTALKQTFQSVYGMPMDAYLRRERIAAAKRLLQETALPVSEIAHRVGYESHSQFTSAFRTGEGRTPTEYRQMVSKSVIYKK